MSNQYDIIRLERAIQKYDSDRDILETEEDNEHKDNGHEIAQWIINLYGMDPSNWMKQPIEEYGFIKESSPEAKQCGDLYRKTLKNPTCQRNFARL